MIPRAVHTAAPVPVQVLSDLKRNEALGVIERIPYGEPVSWCHHTVLTKKHNGTPRRTVDLSLLNKHCKRETFLTESPFHLARRVPKGTWETVSDVWNGYHSVPLRQSDRHLTTFITPFGRWRYTRAPQCFLSSGDGYNRRFDAILYDFERKERCVDDNIQYDTDLQTQWWRTIDFLIRVGQAAESSSMQRNSISRGEWLTSQGSAYPTKPSSPCQNTWTPSATFLRQHLPRTFAAGLALLIRLRTMHNCATLWHHSSHFSAQGADSNGHPNLKEPSKHLKSLSSQRSAMVSKSSTQRNEPAYAQIGLVKASGTSCHRNIVRVTRLPDWCTDGWRVTLAGSRFLTSAEQRYAPIEGEPLAVA